MAVNPFDGGAWSPAGGEGEAVGEAVPPRATPEVPTAPAPPVPEAIGGRPTPAEATIGELGT
jgi:hypothetical protein